MQIVIDISEHYYENNIKKELPICLTEEQVVTILPKGHGRLIDADALNLDYEVKMADDWKTAHEVANCVKYAPTIIEEDKER